MSVKGAENQKQDKIIPKYDEDESLIEVEASESGQDGESQDQENGESEVISIKEEHDEESNDMDIDIDNEQPEDIEIDVEEGELQTSQKMLIELLYNSQNIGKFKDAEKQIYEKHQFCEISLKDIHRALRKDDKEEAQGRMHILTWKICETDIIPLLLNYENNEKVQQLGVIILVDVTEELPSICEHRDRINYLLTDLQTSFANSKLIKHLSNILAEATSKLSEVNSMREELKRTETADPDEKKKIDELTISIAETESKYQAIIELIFVLFKQMLNIISPELIKQNLDNIILILDELAKNKVFEAITYYFNKINSDFHRRLSITLLELMYFMLRPFTVGVLYEYTDSLSSKGKDKKPMTHLQRLRAEEKMEKEVRMKHYSNRHSSFGTMIKVKRPMDDSSFIVSNLNHLESKTLHAKMNKVKKQQRKPQRRLNTRLKNIFNQGALEEIQYINDLNIRENMHPDLYDYNTLENIKVFCYNFLSKGCFTTMVNHFIGEIIMNDDQEEVQKYDAYHFFNVMVFLLEFHRVSEYRHKEAHKDSKTLFRMEDISAVFNMELMDFSYSLCFVNSDDKNKERKVYDFYTALRLVKILLLLCIDAYKNTSVKSQAGDSINEYLNISVKVQDALLTKDFNRILKNMFFFFKEAYYPGRLLAECIELCEVYFSVLNLASSKRELTIKTKKRKRKRNKGEDEEEMARKQADSAESSEDSVEEYLVKERRLVLNEEISNVLVDYSVVRKMLCLVYNQEQVIKPFSKLALSVRYLSKLFHRIANQLKQSWIFYNLEILNILYEVLNDDWFGSSSIFADFVKVANTILTNFFNDMAKNKLLGVESLFRINSSLLKDSVLNNYEDMLFNQFDDLNNDNEDYKSRRSVYSLDEEYDGMIAFQKGEEGENKKKKQTMQVREITEQKGDWVENEDLLLVDNYLEYSSFSNLYDILIKIFSGRTKKEIKSRIKLLKLKKGKERAIKEIKKLHSERREKPPKEKLYNIIVDLSDQCREEQTKERIGKTINILRNQLESYKLRKGLVEETEKDLDYILIPTSKEEKETLSDCKFQAFIRNLGFTSKSEDQERKVWQLDKGKTDGDIEIIISKLQNFEKVIQENTDMVNEINQQREKEKLAAIGEMEDELRKIRKSKKKRKHRKKKRPEIQEPPDEQDSRIEKLRKKSYHQEDDDQIDCAYSKSLADFKDEGKSVISSLTYLINDSVRPTKKKLKKSTGNDF